MPHTKVFIHYIWSTKNRENIISRELKPLLLQHIKENSINKEIYIDCMNCTTDHIHLLVSLGAEQTVAKTAMLIKGESSFWVNRQKLIHGKFEWQDEYFAVSVSESIVDRVRDYIKNQEDHHKHKTFQEEYDEFISKYGFEKFNDEK